MNALFSSFQATILGGKYSVAGEMSAQELLQKSFVDAVVRSRRLTRKEDNEKFTKTAICCHLRGGGYVELPLSTESSLRDGDVVEPNSVKALALTREGDDKPIFRFDGKKA